MSRMKRWRWVLLLIPLLAIGGFVVWAESTPSPMPQAIEALETPAREDGVVVMTRGWLAFRPTAQEPVTGLILYPGGRVDPRAYAPAARAIAAEGYLAVIVPVPLNLAFFAPNRADDVIEAFPQIDHWAVGGHSLGGVVAARFAHRHPSLVEGLVLWASYPAAADDLSNSDLEVVSIYGTRDGLASEDEIESSRALLPPDTRWVAVEGGNHAQFGWYGPQSRDKPATISREAQQERVVAATTELLRQTSGDLTATPTSLGHSTGFARVIHRIRPFDGLRRSAMFAMSDADGAWSPLFTGAAAVTAPFGRLLSRSLNAACECETAPAVSVPGGCQPQAGTTMTGDGYRGQIALGSAPVLHISSERRHRGMEGVP